MKWSQEKVVAFFVTCVAFCGLCVYFNGTLIQYYQRSDNTDVAAQMFQNTEPAILKTTRAPISKGDFQRLDLKNDKKSFVIYTRYRSGSSFVGELFRNHPDIYYMFEPLKLLSLQQKMNYSFINKMASYNLHRLLNCEFLDYIDMATSLSIEGLELYMLFWKCRIFDHNNRKKCKDILITQHEEFCSIHKYTVAKIISVTSLNGLLDLLKAKTKVIHLVRDPRSTVLSRATIAASKANKSLTAYLEYVHKNPSLLNTACNNLHSDLTLLRILHEAKDETATYVKENYKIVRYEDVALEPETWTKAMYKFIDIPIHSNVMRWIKENTQSSQETKKSGFFSTSRNSSEVLRKWHDELPFKLVEQIQHDCAKAMDILGYKLALNKTSLKTDPLLLPNEQLHNTWLKDFLLQSQR